MNPLKSLRRSAIVLLAIGALVACDSDAPPPPPAPPPPAFTPVTSADWYGKIVGEAITTRNVHLQAGGLTQTNETSSVVTLTSTVSRAGVRALKIGGSWNHREVNDLVGPCFRQYSTSLSESELPEQTVMGAGPAPGVASGYYTVRVDERGEYAFAEAIGPIVPVLSAVALTSIDVDNYAAMGSCESSTSEATQRTDVGQIGAGIPLDRVKGKGARDGKSSSGQASWREGDTAYRLSWSLKKFKELEADAGGPYQVERGTKVTLDGSRSHGDIQEYVWTLTPRADCENTGEIGLTAGKSVEVKGKTYSFTAICGVDVRLVVRGPNDTEDPDTQQVTVRAREWKTPYTPPEITFIDEDPLVGGRNQCAFEPVSVGKRTGHYLHRTPDAPGYAVKQVDDPDGPFAGAFYLVSPDLKVWRREMLEEAYMAEHVGNGGEVVGEGSVYRGTGAPFNAELAAQIRAHEHAHSTLLEDALKRDRGKRNPAQLLEPLVANDEVRLRAAAGDSIDKSERVLCEATQHPFVFAKLGAFAGKSGRVQSAGGTFIADVANLQTLANDDVTCP